MSDTAKIIGRDDAGATERWQAPEVGALLEEPAEPEAAAEPAPGEEPPAEAEPETSTLDPEELERLRQEAREEGYQAGFEQGREEGQSAGQAAVDQEADRFRQIIDALERPLAELDREVEDQLTRLAVVLAQQLVRRELHQHPDEIIPVIREASSLLPVAEREVRVRVNPEDAQVIRDRLNLEADNEAGWVLEEDPAISPGGCVVRSGKAQVDARLEKRLAELAARVLGDERETEQ